MAFIVSPSLPRIGISVEAAPLCAKPAPSSILVTRTFEIQAAKHAQFKGAKKHDRLRPKKHRPSDINRKPPPYDTEPLLADGVPPAWTTENVDTDKAIADLGSDTSIGRESAQQ